MAWYSTSGSPVSGSTALDTDFSASLHTPLGCVANFSQSPNHALNSGVRTCVCWAGVSFEGVTGSTLAFDGSFRDGEGAGHFTFTPNETYLSTLRSMKSIS